jgi:hypothetical protein
VLAIKDVCRYRKWYHDELTQYEWRSAKGIALKTRSVWQCGAVVAVCCTQQKTRVDIERNVNKRNAKGELQIGMCLK